MDKQALELLAKLRQQYESFPYDGNEPIEKSPPNEYLSLYHHSKTIIRKLVSRVIMYCF